MRHVGFYKNCKQPIKRNKMIHFLDFFMYNIYLSVFSQTFRTIKIRLNINAKLVFVKTYQDLKLNLRH